MGALRMYFPWPLPDAGGQLSAPPSTCISGLAGSGMRVIGDAIARRVRPIVCAAGQVDNTHFYVTLLGLNVL